ncbi:MAG TPA: nitroreductase family protein [Planctomycetes bacterium]|nr:nitroreductase family protein [Planctomycetota bacterium]
MTEPAARFQPLQFTRLRPEEMLARAEAMRDELRGRRSVRAFSDEPIPEGVVEACVEAAGLAPSGANRQPWTFVLVSDAKTKRAIREAAEREERELYERRITPEWREALAPLGTNWEKPFLERAPVLCVLFRHSFDVEEGRKRTNYYTQESVGIALGFFLAALHRAGLATLTHTPSPMGFLAELLGRPKGEKPYVLLPIGFPEEGCEVPSIEKKSLDEILVRFSPRA